MKIIYKRDLGFLDAALAKVLKDIIHLWLLKRGIWGHSKAVKVIWKFLKIFEWYKGAYNVVTLTELNPEKEIDVDIFERCVHRVVLKNPNLRYFPFKCWSGWSSLQL